MKHFIDIYFSFLTYSLTQYQSPLLWEMDIFSKEEAMWSKWLDMIVHNYKHPIDHNVVLQQLISILYAYLP